MRFSLMVAALLAVCGCATYVDVQRDQRPIYSVLDAKPGVGLLEVSVPDDVLARAPNDFSNMTGLISKVMRDYVDGRGEFNADDYTQLGFKAKWQKSQDARVDAPPMRVASLEGVPAGVATPLVVSMAYAFEPSISMTRRRVPAASSRA